MIRAIRGTRDLLPPDTDLWNRVEDKVRAIFARYNFHEIRTPIFEDTQLFSRGVGEETDIVTKEMFTWEDKGRAASEKSQSLTLRPEATAGIVRAYIEHGLDKRGTLQKLYCLGPHVPPRAPAERTLSPVLSRSTPRSSARPAQAASLLRATPKCWRCSPRCSTNSACAAGRCNSTPWAAPPTARVITRRCARRSSRSST